MLLSTIRGLEIVVPPMLTSTNCTPARPGTLKVTVRLPIESVIGTPSQTSKPPIERSVNAEFGVKPEASRVTMDPTAASVADNVTSGAGTVSS